MDYVSDEIPSVKVHLEAWSPKIPQDSKSSAYPAIVFDFHVNNPTKEDVDVSFGGSFDYIPSSLESDKYILI